MDSLGSFRPYSVLLSFFGFEVFEQERKIFKILMKISFYTFILMFFYSSIFVFEILFKQLKESTNEKFILSAVFLITIIFFKFTCLCLYLNYSESTKFLKECLKSLTRFDKLSQDIFSMGTSTYKKVQQRSLCLLLISGMLVLTSLINRLAFIPFDATRYIVGVINHMVDILQLWHLCLYLTLYFNILFRLKALHRKIVKNHDTLRILLIEASEACNHIGKGFGTNILLVIGSKLHKLIILREFIKLFSYLVHTIFEVIADSFYLILNWFQDKQSIASIFGIENGL